MYQAWVSYLKAYTSASLLCNLTWLARPVAGFRGTAGASARPAGCACLLSSSKFDAPAECIMCLLIQIRSAVHALFPGAHVKLHYPVRFQGRAVCSEQTSGDGSAPTGRPLSHTGKKKKQLAWSKNLFFCFFKKHFPPPLLNTNSRTHDSLVDLCCSIAVRQNHRAVKRVKTAYVYRPCGLVSNPGCAQRQVRLAAP